MTHDNRVDLNIMQDCYLETTTKKDFLEIIVSSLSRSLRSF